MMTEREAWLWLAKRFSRAGAKGVLINGWRYQGICNCIDAIDAITTSATAMIHRIRANRPAFAHVRVCLASGGYWWPTTKNGNQRRAAFCRRMAKECK